MGASNMSTCFPAYLSALPHVPFEPSEPILQQPTHMLGAYPSANPPPDSPLTYLKDVISQRSFKH